MRVRPAFALLGALAATMLVGATGTASADEVWEQQYQRESSTAACPPPADETPWQATYTGQREWAGSWAQWPNDGQGGWVCRRSIVWAVSMPSRVGCIRWADTYGFYPGPLFYDFGYSQYLASGSPTYTDASCTASLGPTSTGTAYASTATAALAICQQYGIGLGYTTVYQRLNNVWSCA